MDVSDLGLCFVFNSDEDLFLYKYGEDYYVVSESQLSVTDFEYPPSVDLTDFEFVADVSFREVKTQRLSFYDYIMADYLDRDWLYNFLNHQRFRLAVINECFPSTEEYLIKGNNLANLKQLIGALAPHEDLENKDMFIEFNPRKVGIKLEIHDEVNDKIFIYDIWNKRIIKDTFND